MTKLTLLLFAISLICRTASAQQASSDFFENPIGIPVYEPLIVSDMELFNIPIEGSYDIFSRLSNYNFSAVRYMRRGYDPAFSKQYVNGVDLSLALSGRVNYNILSALRYVPGSRSYTSGSGMSAGMVGVLSGIEEISVNPADARPGGMISLLASDKSSRYGFRAALNGNISANKWLYSISLGRRWGRDVHVQGLFMDELNAAVSLERKFADKGSLTLFAVATSGERSTRAASTNEAFSLTGDNLYNPSWGWLDGKERSSRVRRNFTPLGIISYKGRLNDKNQLNISASYMGGENSYSGLSWFDAQSPLPDYYRYMPSFIAEPGISSQVAQMWRSCDPQVTQIDWKEMSYQNIMADGQAVYMVDEAVESYRNIQLMAGITSHPQRRLTTGYGIRAKMDRTDNFNRLKDLMGAQWTADVDQYLVDDEFYGNMARNDLRNPDRLVGEGERYDYNYIFDRRSVGAYAIINYGDRRYRLGAGIEINDVAVQRNGLYEKELFPGAQSFGKSSEFRFSEYLVKLCAGYSMGVRQSLDANVLFANNSPLAADIFLSPRYCNLTADAPKAYSIFSAELSYRLVLSRVRIKLTGFYTQTGDQTDIYHYYDDLSSEYCNLVASDISRRYYGVELGAEITFSPRFSLLSAASTGSHTYASDPVMNLYADADGSAVYLNQRAPLTNYRTGGTPQTIVTTELKYSGTKGWFASLTLNYMADNYISLDPTRRMMRASNYCTSPEILRQMVVQECFPSASTLGLFVCKSFNLSQGNLTALFSVANLLDNRDIIYSGYEQMRLTRTGDGINRTYTPFDSKYTYSYGRTWYASVIYKF